MTVTNMIDLIHAATGYALSKTDLKEIVRNILRMESILQNKAGYQSDKSPLPQLREGQISEISKMEEQTHESIVYRTTS
jgi:aldehyde:ferredoxin oxidoreductase